MIDAVYFQEANPNYTRPRISESGKQDSTDIGGIIFWSDGDSAKRSNQVKSNGKDPAEMKEDDLILCSPTVPGFSYGNILWAEFAVADIQDINWNPVAFAQLAIPTKQKEVIQALAEAHTGRETQYRLDDFVVGKGLGLIILLHGLTGEGKTLTAEGISEHLQRPLYSISAGELGTSVEKLETQLPLIFQRADKWNAVLLDEADVFLEQRSLHDVHRNALVSVFLRELEYFQGVMFLTTNRVKQIDDAIASRIHLPLKYESLSLAARRGIWESFLKKAVTKKGVACYSRADLDSLAKKDLNGRQIKNIISAAFALASRKRDRVAMSHLEVAIAAGEDFECDFKGAGQVGNMQSYV
ncbi:MAG: hypothetical protein LQ343_000988 [Gyalolechia ehrenbergii]|nr:MAG: hypothetical protein LQ343_000988 [Gyalolechia ehrenbergii]